MDTNEKYPLKALGTLTDGLTWWLKYGVWVGSMLGVPLLAQAQWVLRTDSSLCEARTFVSVGSTLKADEPVLKLSLNEPGRLPDELDHLRDLRLLEVYAPEAMPTFRLLPTSLWKLSKLEYLHLGQTALDSLPAALHQLTALRVLSLPANPALKQLPEAVSFLPNLEELDAGTAALPPNLSRAPRLRVLHTRADRLPPLPHLEELHYSGSQLPEFVASLPNLRAVHLTAAAHPAHASLKPLLGLPTLTTLSLDAARIDRYGWEHLGRLVGLQSLTLRRVRYIPDDLHNLNQLTEVSILQTPCPTAGSCVPVIGPLAQLPRLRRLTLNHLPDNLDTLQQLESLRLIDCPDLKAGDFRRLSRQLARLPRLDELDLQGSDLRNARQVAFDALAKLRKLNLAFTGLPPDDSTWISLKKLTSLRELTLTGDDLGLAQCPEALGQLRQLRLLTLYAREGRNNRPLPPGCIDRLRRALPTCVIQVYR
mgnify:CR=1 FL=1